MMMNKKTMMGAFALMLACAFMISAIPAMESDAAADTHKITYVVGGDEYVKTFTPSIDVVKVVLAAPADLGVPAVPGKDFKGWYNGSDKVTEVAIGNCEASDDYQVEARYIVKTYTVTFIANGMDDAAGTYNYNADAVVPVAKATPADAGYVVPEGYAFAGWSNGTATLAAIPKVTASVTYVAVFEKIVPAPVTHTVTFMKDGAVYNTQTVSDVLNAIAPYIEGYTWEAMIVGADGNAVVNAKAIPKAADNSLGIDNFTLAVIVIVLIAVIGIVLYVAYEQGFLPVGKNKIAGDAKR